MENLINVIGFLLCFLMGAYIREPFLFKKEKEIVKEIEDKEEQTRIKEWNNLLSYTGEKQDED